MPERRAFLYCYYENTSKAMAFMPFFCSDAGRDVFLCKREGL